MAMDGRIATDESRHRYTMTCAAALLEDVEAATHGRRASDIWRAETRLGVETTNELGRQFQALVFSAAKTLPARRYEDYIAALHAVNDGFRINVSVPKKVGDYSGHDTGFYSVAKFHGYPTPATRAERAMRFVLFAMNLYSEILAQPESATKFPPVKSTRAYQTWARGASNGD